MPSKGAVALARICKEDERGQVGVAERLNEHQSLLSRWINEERTPGLENRKKLEDDLGIPFWSWDEPAEEEPPASSKEPTEPAAKAKTSNSAAE